MIKQNIPLVLLFLTCIFCIPSLINFRRNYKRFMIPIKGFSSERNFIISQRRAMTLFLALFIRRSKSNNCFTANQSGFVSFIFCLFQCASYFVVVVSINITYNVPPISFETFFCIICKPILNFAID